jgi:hypothetical protein
MPLLFAVYDKYCGHVLGVHADRRTFEPVIAALAGLGRYSLRTRRATDADLLAVMQGVKCEHCAGHRMSLNVPATEPGKEGSNS